MPDFVEKRQDFHGIISHRDGWGQSMMGERQVRQDALRVFAGTACAGKASAAVD
jgi:hypothetical protein